MDKCFVKSYMRDIGIVEILPSLETTDGREIGEITNYDEKQ